MWSTRSRLRATEALRRSALGWLPVAVVACARPSAPAAAPPASPPDVAATRGPARELEEVLAAVDPRELERTVRALVAFETRHTASATDDPRRGIGAARTYLHERLESFGGALEVERERFELAPDGDEIVAPVEAVNVVARLPGRLPEARARHYYVVAHYDSRASDGRDGRAPAPGANDDGSGVAVVMELARLLAARPQEATVVFLLTAAEEQGLYGAHHHAEQARRAGVDVRAVLSNDVVGDPSSEIGPPVRDRVRVFAPGRPMLEPDARGLLEHGGLDDGASRALARFVAEVAAAHPRALPVRPMLVLRSDRMMRGGDHLAFVERGFAAVRLTEVEEALARQHQDPRVEGGVRYGDVPDALDWDYLAGVARLDLAVLVHLANAPSPPADVRLEHALSPTTTLRWQASPEPDVAGYEVVWRETTSFAWQGALDVGMRLHATLRLNKDNHVLGVRAYDLDGLRSPASAAR